MARQCLPQALTPAWDKAFKLYGQQQPAQGLGRFAQLLASHKFQSVVLLPGDDRWRFLQTVYTGTQLGRESSYVPLNAGNGNNNNATTPLWGGSTSKLAATSGAVSPPADMN